MIRRFMAKLGFVHRTLWQRDAAYRWAVLLGPPPAIGVAAAAVLLTALPAIRPGAPTQAADAPWAHWTRPPPEESEPFAEPTLKLPPRDASGQYPGWRAGWRGEVHPMSVDATREANVSGTALAGFTLDQPDIPLQRVVDAGPPTGLFVGEAQSFYVVPEPGLYAFSARLARSGTQSADCLVRLISSRHRMVRNVALDTDAATVLNYRPRVFRLEPGLFRIAVALGCWRGDRVVGGGDFTLMVRNPGEAALRPARADELLRRAP